jgi:hypothetical protein
MGKYQACPICNKKGLYRDSGRRSIIMRCRYCYSHWTISQWAIKTIRGTNICPDCGYKSPFGDVVYSHYEPIPQDKIDKSIAREKHNYKHTHKAR